MIHTGTIVLLCNVLVKLHMAASAFVIDTAEGVWRVASGETANNDHWSCVRLMLLQCRMELQLLDADSLLSSFSQRSASIYALSIHTAVCVLHYLQPAFTVHTAATDGIVHTALGSAARLCTHSSAQTAAAILPSLYLAAIMSTAAVNSFSAAATPAAALTAVFGVSADDVNGEKIIRNQAGKSAEVRVQCTAR